MKAFAYLAFYSFFVLVIGCSFARKMTLSIDCEKIRSPYCGGAGNVVYNAETYFSVFR